MRYRFIFIWDLSRVIIYDKRPLTRVTRAGSIVAIPCYVWYIKDTGFYQDILKTDVLSVNAEKVCFRLSYMIHLPVACHFFYQTSTKTDMKTSRELLMRHPRAIITSIRDNICAPKVMGCKIYGILSKMGQWCSMDFEDVTQNRGK